MENSVNGVGNYDLAYKKADEQKAQVQKEEPVSIMEEVKSDSMITKESYDELYNEFKNIEVLNEAVSEVTTPPESQQITQPRTVNETQEVNEIYNLNGAEFCQSLRSDIKIELINYLESEVNIIQDSLDDTRRHNGLISGAWDGIKNLFNFGASSNKAQDEVDNLKTAIESVKQNPDKLAEVYKTITGKELNAAEYDKICTGESSLTTSTKASQSVSKYQDGQRMSTDVFADVVVGFTSAAAIAAAPFTGGASLALGAVVGAAVKPAVKGADALSGGREYNLKDLGYDAVTGGVGGAMSFVGIGIGNVASTGIGKAAGLPMLEKVVSTKIGGAAFNFAAKGAARYSVGFASGAADAVARDIMTGETDNILKDALSQGHAAGTTSVILGAAGDAVHAGVNKIKGAKATPVADGVPTHKNEIVEGDGRKLSPTDAPKSNPLKQMDDELLDLETKFQNNELSSADYMAQKEAIYKQYVEIETPTKTYTPEDLAAAQSKVDDLYNEALKYQGEQIPESLQKEYTKALDELNNIKSSQNPDAKAKADVDTAETKVDTEVKPIKADVNDGANQPKKGANDVLLGKSGSFDPDSPELFKDKIISDKFSDGENIHIEYEDGSYYHDYGNGRTIKHDGATGTSIINEADGSIVTHRFNEDFGKTIIETQDINGNIKYTDIDGKPIDTNTPPKPAAAKQPVEPVDDALSHDELNERLSKTDVSDAASKAQPDTTSPKVSNSSEVKSKASIEKLKNSPEYEIKKQQLKTSLDGDIYEYDMPMSVNKKLRAGMKVSELPDDLRMQVEIADENWKNLPLTQQEQTLYRGESPTNMYVRNNKKAADLAVKHYNEIKNAKVGDIITDEGYSYASHSNNETTAMYSKASSDNFATKGNEAIVYEIKVPKGSQIFDQDTQIVMPRNSSYKILSKNVDENGLVNITMEYIIPS